ncbi:hypothetical protein WDU94_000716, partial [Cyamophila willieti]
MFCKKKNRQSVANKITPKSPRKKSQLLRTYLLLGCDSNLSSIVSRSVESTEKKMSMPNFKVRKKPACSLQTILEPPEHEKRIRAYSITREGSKTMVDEMTNEENEPKDWNKLLSQLLGDQVKVARINRSGDRTKEKISKCQSQKNQSMKTEDCTNKTCNVFRLRIPKLEKNPMSKYSEHLELKTRQAPNNVSHNHNHGEVTNNAVPETVNKHNGDRNQNLVHALNERQNEYLNENPRYMVLTSPSQTAQNGTHSQHPHIHHGSYRRANSSHDQNKEQSSNNHGSYRSANNAHGNKDQSSNYRGSYRIANNNSHDQNKELSSNNNISQHLQKKEKIINVLSLNNLIELDETVIHTKDYVEPPNKNLHELEHMAQKLKTKWRSSPYVDESKEIDHNMSESRDRFLNTTEHVWDKDILSGRNSNEPVVQGKRYSDKFRDPTAKVLNDLQSLQDDFQSVSRALTEANADCDGMLFGSNIPSKPEPASYLPQYVYDPNNNYVILQPAPAPEPFVSYNPDKSHDTKRSRTSCSVQKTHKNEHKQGSNRVKLRTHEHKVSYRAHTDPSMKSNTKKTSQNPVESAANSDISHTFFQTARNSQAYNLSLEPNDQYSNRLERLAPIETPATPVHVIPLLPPDHIVPKPHNAPKTKLPLPPGCYYLTSQGYLYPTYNPQAPNVLPKPQYVISSDFYPNQGYVPQPGYCEPRPHQSKVSVKDSPTSVYILPRQTKNSRRCPFQAKPQKTYSYFVHGNHNPDTELDGDSFEWQVTDQSSDESVHEDIEEMKEKSAQIEYLIENVKQIGQQYYEMSSKTMVPVLRLFQNQLICRFYNLRQYVNKTLQRYVETYETDSRRGSEISFVSSDEL